MWHSLTQTSNTCQEKKKIRRNNTRILDEGKKTQQSFFQFWVYYLTICFLLIASRGTNQITSSRIKSAHKEQSQARPYTSEAPPKQCLEDQAKTRSYTLRNIVKTKHQPVEFMGGKNLNTLYCQVTLRCPVARPRKM